jgi:hypothetical protein
MVLGYERATHFVEVEYEVKLANILECAIQRFHKDLPALALHFSPVSPLTCIRSRIPSSDSAPSTTNLTQLASADRNPMPSTDTK